MGKLRSWPPGPQHCARLHATEGTPARPVAGWSQRDLVSCIPQERKSCKAGARPEVGQDHDDTDAAQARLCKDEIQAP